MDKILILGATGSIGVSTLEIVKQHRDKYEVIGIVANNNAKGLAELAKEYNVKSVGINNPEKAKELKEYLSGTNIKIYVGDDEICELASQPHDTTISAIVGVAGLKPTMAALNGTKKLALANKESIICAGSIILEKAKKNNVKVIPVDSEHNALFQVFEADKIENITKLTITASGGPFKNFSLADMTDITPEQAVKHPNWSMGAKISVDSATLMNKGLEFIEACVLFNMPAFKVDVVIHPQSIIHGMVHYSDGSVLAQLSPPDMKTPISYALAYPKRIEIEHKSLDLAKIGSLTFDAPDYTRFPLLKLAIDTYGTGQSELIKLNTANEVAVNAFLNKKIGFLDIPKIVKNTVAKFDSANLNLIEEVLEYNAEVIKFSESNLSS